MRYSVYKFNGGEIAFSKPLLYRRRDWACVMYVFLSAELLKGSHWNAVPVMVIAVFQRLCTKHCIFNHNFPMHGRIVLSSIWLIFSEGRLSWCTNRNLNCVLAFLNWEHCPATVVLAAGFNFDLLFYELFLNRRERWEILNVYYKNCYSLKVQVSLKCSVYCLSFFLLLSFKQFIKKKSQHIRWLF